MLEEWLFFLLPIAAASGWYAAQRYYSRKYLLERTERLRSAYSRSLNYLLSEKTDQAIEALSSLCTNDSETIETHIALGNSFRRRGELERAIEIHEHLIDKDNLTPEQRSCAQFELGMDYLRAGLFDRAESIFSNLADHEHLGKAALQRLLQIYEHEKEWLKAIESIRKLASFGPLPRGETIAQFYCELAEEALTAGRDSKAQTLLGKALKDDARCVRATLLLARLHMREGKFDEALQVLKRVESQNPAYLPEILEPLRTCHERLDRPVDELLGYLGYLYETYGFESAALALAQQLRSARGLNRAAEHLQRVLDTQPSLKSLNMFSGLLLEESGDHQRDALIRLDRALDRLAQSQTRYRCEQCGFTGSELYWRCPSCQHWETMRPI